MIESDFQREYHIDLSQSDMSWRRFLALLSGLSGESIFFARIHKQKEEEKNKPIEGAENIAHHMASMMGARKR